MVNQFSTTERPILIVGGNGKTGACVNTRLSKLGYQTRPVSRSTAIRFDWEDRATWEAAIQGTHAAYVTFQPDLAAPGADKAIAEFARIALAHNLERVVLLSGRGEDGALLAEDALKNSGISWTIVRASWFFQNFSEGLMLEGILAGNLVLPAGAVREPFIDAEDIADVAVAALIEPGHADRVYDITGPRAFTFADAVSEISAALNRPINYTQVPIDDFVNALRADGVPEDFLWLLRELFTKVLDGRNSEITRGVAAALHRPARDFSDYVRRTMESDVWQIAQANRK